MTVQEQDERRERLARLEPFVGAWRIEAPAFPLPAEQVEEARMTIEWVLGGAFLLQRSLIPVPGAPDAHSLIGPDAFGDGYVQHYFDSRGIARVYAMAFDGRAWTLERRRPDFTPLSFHQRWIGAFSVDGRAIEGRWEASQDGSAWELDFELTYRRVG